MSTFRSAYARPMKDIFEEAFDVLRQDASEYAYIGLVGAVIASIAVLIPAIIGGPVAIAFIAPLVTIIAVMTLGTCEAALSNVSTGLQPDAANAGRAAAWRTVPLLRPWLLLAGTLFAASLAVGLAAPHFGPVPPMVAVPLLITVAAFYAYPRSLYTAALFERDMTSRDATRVSVRLVDRAGSRVAKAWAVVAAPATLIAALCALAGFDFVAGAIVVFFFVGALPVAAVLMSLLFIDAASSAEVAANPAPNAAIAQRRI